MTDTRIEELQQQIRLLKKQIAVHDIGKRSEALDKLVQEKRPLEAEVSQLINRQVLNAQG